SPAWGDVLLESANRCKAEMDQAAHQSRFMSTCSDCPSCQRAAAVIIDLTPKSVPTSRPSRTPQEGRIAIVTDVGRGMRWTRQRAQTNGANADGEVVWS